MRKVIIPGLVAGAAMLAAGMALSFLFSAIFPGIQAEYQNPAMFRPWSDPLMMLYYLYPFLLGLVLARAWNKIKGSIGGVTNAKKGINFALGYWLVASIPGMFITYSSFKVSLLMVISWTLSGLVQAIIAGAICARMNRCV